MRLYCVVEISIPSDKMPPGVQVEDIGEKITTAVWGSVVPVLNLDADKKDSMSCLVHWHQSTYDRACPTCRSFADDERN